MISLLYPLVLGTGTHDVATGSTLPVDGRAGFVLAHTTHQSYLLDLKYDLVTGYDLPVELGIVYFDQVINSTDIIRCCQGNVCQNATCLCHGFQYQNTRHHRHSGEVALEKRFIDTHVLNSREGYFRLQRIGKYPVYKKKRYRCGNIFFSSSISIGVSIIFSIFFGLFFKA